MDVKKCALALAASGAQSRARRPRSAHRDPSCARGLQLCCLFQEGSFKGDIDIDVEVDVEVDVDIDSYLGCLETGLKVSLGTV